MDPNATLNIMLDRAQAILEAVDAMPDEHADDFGDAAAEMAEAVENLHGCIRNGGFLPAVWVTGKVRK